MACKQCGGIGKVQRPVNQDEYDREFDRLYDTGQFSAQMVHSRLANSEPHEWVPCPYCAIIEYLANNGPSSLRTLEQELKMSESELRKTVLVLMDSGEIETVTLMEMVDKNLPGYELYIRLPGELK